MNRNIYKSLTNWKNNKSRRPLLLRGARQTGKTFIINHFGDNEFPSRITLNFERNPEYKEIFENFNPEKIIEKISLFTGQKIKKGKTLLFLDEIQDCPKAIMSLRYFYEEMPELHVIGAGSLLEFSLNSENFRVPVGRVQYMYLKPMSFGEFLEAIDENILRKYISNFSNIEKIPDAIHNKLNELLRKYFILGGMPAVIKDYVQNKDILKCQKIQHSLIETFIDDFAKYSNNSQHKYLQKIFYSVPALIGNKFVYAKVDNTLKSRDLKNAVELLEQAGIVFMVKKTSGAGLPLEAGIKNNFYKLIFLDIGLMHALSGIYTETARQKDFTAIYNGAVTEQFVGQELIANNEPEIKPSLYYWGRESKSSNAEVDYLIAQNSEIIPIEVKSGTKGIMKSLLMFIEKYKTKKALKISQAKYSYSKPITNLPLYAVESFSNNNQTS